VKRVKVCPHAISYVRPRQTIQPIRTKITWTKSKHFCGLYKLDTLDSNEKLLRTSTRSPTSKMMHRTPVWSIECSRTILVISNVRIKWIFPCSFLKFCNFAWIMQSLTNNLQYIPKVGFEVNYNYAKSKHRRISEALCTLLWEVFPLVL